MGARFDLWRQRNRNGNTWRYPSLRYQRKSDNLWKQYHEGKIDHSSYLELLEQIKNEELTDEDKRHMGLLGPDGRERIENDIWEYENEQQKIRELIAQAERFKSLPPLEKYKEEIPQTITRYKEESQHYRRLANYLQGIIIIGSVLVTSATSAVGFGLFGDIFRWVALIISIVVAVSAGFIGYFKFRERSFNLQQTADNIEQEYKAVKLGISYYKGKRPDEALELFAERVELLIEEQKKRQQQLEQPPDMKHVQNHL
jgi:hypothetical protein